MVVVERVGQERLRQESVAWSFLRVVELTSELLWGDFCMVLPGHTRIWSKYESGSLTQGAMGSVRNHGVKPIAEPNVQ